jgi:hypothetical protein
MKKLLIIFLTGVVVSGYPLKSFSLDVSLYFIKTMSQWESFSPQGYGNCQLRSSIPPGDWKLPKITSKNPWYGIIRLGDKQHLIITDIKKAEENGYSRLWFDSNGDGDLTDEKPLDGTVEDQMRMPQGFFQSSFPIVDVTITVDGENMPYCIKPSLYGGGSSFGRSNISLSYSSPCAYIGVFKNGSTKYTVEVVDTNGNGRFTDFSKVMDMDRNIVGINYPLYSQGDTMYLTDGKVMNYNDGMNLGDFLFVNDKLFKVEVYASKGKMILTEQKTGLFPVILSIEPEHLQLSSGDNQHFVMAYKPVNGRIMLPPDNYRLISYSTYRKDDQGDLWYLRAMGTQASSQIIVSKESKTDVSIGEPFLPVVNFRDFNKIPDGKTGMNIPLTFNLEGKAKEVLVDITHVQGVKTKIQLSLKPGSVNRPKEPAYAILKSDGEIVAKGIFEYG